MDSMLIFLTGPGLYASLAVFVIGLTVRLVLYFTGLDSMKDRVAYKANLGHGLKGGFHSAFKWLIPFATSGWRSQPLLTAGFALLHVGVVVVPLFLVGHNTILKQVFGFSLFTIPQIVADVLTGLGLVGFLILLLRRIMLPQVRILTTKEDYFILALVFLPLLSGFLICQEIGDYNLMLLCHLFSGEILLILAPFTKLSHIVLYFASRIQIGMDFAIKRGGRNRDSGAYFPW